MLTLSSTYENLKLNMIIIPSAPLIIPCYGGMEERCDYSISFSFPDLTNFKTIYISFFSNFCLCRTTTSFSVLSVNHLLQAAGRDTSSKFLAATLVAVKSCVLIF